MRRSIQPVADAKLAHARNETLDEFVVYDFVNDDTACGRASLPRGAELASHAAVHCQIELRIVHHHDDVLAAHLEMHLLEPGRGALVHFPADGR